MKHHLLALALLLSLSFCLPATVRADASWETNLKKAQDQAKASNKLVFLDFTGSDWCGWCIRQDKDIFSKPAFKEYASKNLVLVEVDFPREKEQSTDVRKQNQQLAQEYGVQGFPTIVVLNGAGQKVWRYDGYFEGGPEAFIAELEKARKG
ncbi:MAG: thioredoxin family protein [Chthoniobacterales bacterium]